MCVNRNDFYPKIAPRLGLRAGVKTSHILEMAQTSTCVSTAFSIKRKTVYFYISWFIKNAAKMSQHYISKGIIKRMKKAHCKLAAVMFITQDELT